MDLLQILQMHSFKPSGNRESIWGGQIGIVNITDIWNRIDTCMDTDSRQQNTKAHAHTNQICFQHNCELTRPLPNRKTWVESDAARS